MADKLLRSGICQCGNKGFFRLADGHAPCGLCKGAVAPRAASGGWRQHAERLERSLGRLERKLASQRTALAKRSATNRKLKRDLYVVLRSAEAQGLNLSRKRGKPKKD